MAAGNSGDPPFLTGDPNERRKLRHEYRNLIADTQKNRLDLIKPDNTGLSDVLQSADRLFSKVRENNATHEAALDSHLLVIVSNLGKQRAQKLQTDFNEFEPTEFAEKLVTYMKGRRVGQNGPQSQPEVQIRPEAWAEIGKEAKKCMRRAPAFHFMLGSFDRELRRKPVKQKPDGQKDLSDKALGPAVVPKQLHTMNKSHQEVTTEEVEKMLGILRQVTNYTGGKGEVDPVSYFEFVVNPQSFSQTVENMFHLAFLVKDGHAEVELDDDRLPVVIPTQPYIEGQSQQRIDKKQVIIDLDMQQWKEIIRVYNITDPLIPTREDPREDPLVNGHSSHHHQKKSKSSKKKR